MRRKASIREYWQTQLSRFYESKLSQSDFCKQQSLNYSSFNHWKRYLEKNTGNDLVEIASRPACSGNKEATVVITIGDSVSVIVALSSFSPVLQNILNLVGRDVQ